MSRAAQPGAAPRDSRLGNGEGKDGESQYDETEACEEQDV
jgi:hypothetical protein